MKRLCCVLLLVSILCMMLPTQAMAVTNEKDVSVIYLDDGYYIIETIAVNASRASGSVTGTKTHTYYDSNGNADWKAVLTGKFTYTGVSATCTSSSVNVTIYNSSWYTISKSATKSANAASASVTMGCKILGVTYNEVAVPITLTCDANGNLS